MKTKKQQQKFKFLIPILLLLFVSSCKKDPVEARPKTAADFEKIMASDKDFNAFIKFSLELEDLSKPEPIPAFILQNNSVKARKILSVSEQETLKKVNNFGEMRTYLNSLKIENTNKIVDVLEKQSTYFKQFIINYPEYKELTFKEKSILLSNALKTDDKVTAPLSSYYRNNGKLMVANQDDLYDFNMAIAGCQAAYRSNFISIWAAADITMVATSWETSGLGTIAAFITACVLTEIAHNAMYECYDLAAGQFFHDIAQ